MNFAWRGRGLENLELEIFVGVLAEWLRQDEIRATLGLLSTQLTLLSTLPPPTRRVYVHSVGHLMMLILLSYVRHPLCNRLLLYYATVAETSSGFMGRLERIVDIVTLTLRAPALA